MEKNTTESEGDGGPLVIGVLGIIRNGWVKRLEDLEIRGNHPDYSIVKNGHNTEKSPEDLRGFAVTKNLLKDHQLT